MKNGGFDAIVGNPPYVGLSNLPNQIVHYLAKAFKDIHSGYNDIMYYFVTQGINLLNSSGVLGVITSNYYLGNSYSRPFREFLKSKVDIIINFKDYLVFQDANVHTNIILARKNTKNKNIKFSIFKGSKKNNQIDFLNDFDSFMQERQSLGKDWIITDTLNQNFIKKIQHNTVKLSEIAQIKKGATSGNREIFTVDETLASKNNFENEIIRKSVNSRDIKRYNLKDSKKYLLYIDSYVKIKNYPNVYNYLLGYKSVLSDRNEVKDGLYEWYRLERPREREIFEAKEKIVVPYRASSNQFAL